MNTTFASVSNFSSTSMSATGYSLPFDTTGHILSAVFIIAFLVIGVIGNALTIAVIATYPNLYRNIFLNFILSLCVSDLTSALVSWIFLYRRTWGFNQWLLPSTLCKIYWSLDIFTSFATACHILSFSILRLISIGKTYSFNSIRLLHGRIWILTIWLICLCFGLIPSIFIFGVNDIDRSFDTGHNARWPVCSILRERIDLYQLFAKIAYPLFLLGSLVGVFITCTIIVCLVYSRSRLPINLRKSRQGKEKQAVLQLLLIIVSFFIGYIPFTAYELWSLQNHDDSDRIRQTDYWFGMIEYLFLRFSESLNPVFYNFGSAKVRYHTKKFIMEKLLCAKHSFKPSFAIKRKMVSPTNTFNTRSGRTFSIGYV